MSAPVAEAAAVLATARLARGRFPGFAQDLHPADEAAGYAVQDALHAALTAAGAGPWAGHKIGCTTQVMQDYLGIRNPSAGGVLAGEVHASPARVAPRGTTRLGVECEVAVRLAHDLPGGACTVEAAAAAVGSCMASIELVEDRYADYPSLDAPTLIADDFFGAGLVLGPEHAGFDPRALAGATATMAIDGAEVGAGRGADILGDPLVALAWLADALAARGRCLQAGEVVTLGSLVATHWVEPGMRIRVVNDPLGEVVLEVADPTG
ncbi:MAG: 2-keto-4-pentenoate hydratase [Actinomycetota bacterium]